VAAWQFNVQLIPAEWISCGNDVATLFNEDGYEGSLAWAEYADVAQLRNFLDTVFRRGTSWSPDLTLRGEEGADDAQLWANGLRIESLEIRFDLRKRNMSFFKGGASVSERMGLSISVVDGMELLGSSFEELLFASRKSSAEKYVRKPNEYLAGGH